MQKCQRDAEKKRRQLGVVLKDAAKNFVSDLTEVHRGQRAKG